MRISRDGTLHVATSSAAWAQELTFLAPEILGRLREQIGADAPAKLRCAVGPIPEAAQAIEVQAPAFPDAEDMPAEVRSEAASAASAITDPELRELVARAARASLLRARTGRNF